MLIPLSPKVYMAPISRVTLHLALNLAVSRRVRNIFHTKRDSLIGTSHIMVVALISSPIFHKLALITLWSKDMLLINSPSGGQLVSNVIEETELMEIPHCWASTTVVGKWVRHPLIFRW